MHLARRRTQDNLNQIVVYASQLEGVIQNPCLLKSVALLCDAEYLDPGPAQARNVARRLVRAAGAPERIPTPGINDLSTPWMYHPRKAAKAMAA